MSSGSKGDAVVGKHLLVAFHTVDGAACAGHGADQKTDALMSEINEVFDARIDGSRVVDADIVHAFVRHFPQDDAGDARRLQRFHVIHIAHVQPDEDEPADALLVEAPHGEALLLRRELRQGHLARVVPLRARFLDRHQVLRRTPHTSAKAGGYRWCPSASWKGSPPSRCRRS